MSLVWIILPLYIITNIYIIRRTNHWAKCYDTPQFYKLFRVIFTALYGIAMLILIIAYFLPESDIHKELQEFANCFVGVYLYLFGTYLIVDLIRIIIKKCHIVKHESLRDKRVLSVLGAFIFCTILAISFYGFSHAEKIYLRDYEVTVDKKIATGNHMRVVLVADLHMGYSIGSEQISKMVSLINEQNADLVVIAGDIFDNTLEGVDDINAIKQSLMSIKSKYGVYGCWGNHDITERLFTGFTVIDREDEKRHPEMDKFMEDCGIVMLNDEAVLINDSIYLVGRKDYEKAGDGTRNRKELDELLTNLDMSKPVFLLEHEPRKLQEVADAGIDVMFSGHTHDGQFFPMNITAGWIWENPTGMLKKDNMTSIVTSGVGIYGPDMRIGTDADVTVVDITFK